MSSNILSAFNDHFVDFVTDIHNVFPDDVDVLTAKNSLLTIRKLNPKMIVKIWNTFIVSKYKNEIEAGDLTFFINKDYADDVSNAQNSDKIMESINRLRNPVKQMSVENQTKVMKYIQNLTKLSAMCENS
jgi:DNA polymerase/3'-5' exonuclease PolX